MAINRVGCNQVSFGNFYVNQNGAHNLASVFVNQPELEQKFMHNIVEPLSHTEKYDVIYNGYSAVIIDDNGKSVMSVIQPGSDAEHILGVVYDEVNHYRNAYRRHSYVIPTNNFEDDVYPLHAIEIAKNIALDKEIMANNQAAETYAKLKDETVEQKYKRLKSQFEYKA